MDVSWSGKTGSERRAVKATLMTRYRLRERAPEGHARPEFPVVGVSAFKQDNKKPAQSGELSGLRFTLRGGPVRAQCNPEDQR